MTETHCQYCNFDEYDVLDKNDFGVILPEPNALSKGHCVIIPLRHVSSFFDITDKERKSLMSLLELARNELQLLFRPYVVYRSRDVAPPVASHTRVRGWDPIGTEDRHKTRK